MDVLEIKHEDKVNKSSVWRSETQNRLCLNRSAKNLQEQSEVFMFIRTHSNSIRLSLLCTQHIQYMICFSLCKVVCVCLGCLYSLSYWLTLMNEYPSLEDCVSVYVYPWLCDFLLCNCFVCYSLCVCVHVCLCMCVFRSVWNSRELLILASV